ncbi:MAG: cytochrome b/b6 domain-containing protein, partial [Bryobacteraceae bacterium]|nr:cytochrome b/b6 domain-containing protein [Bryobacteraceae bacterium]
MRDKDPDLDSVAVHARNRTARRIAGWRSPWAILTAGGVSFLTLSGLFILFGPFSVPNQVNVLVHTALGIVFLIPCGWYLVRHFRDYWRTPWSHNLLLGYLGGAAVLVCAVSGVVLSIQAAFDVRISYAWDTVHIVSTFATLAFVVPHLVVLIVRARRARNAGDTSPVPQAQGHFGRGVAWLTAGGVALVTLLAYAYTPVRLNHRFPEDYSYRYGKDRPFAPSLARTVTGGAVDARVFAGSRSCGTSGCHEEIVKEWEPSAHRYAAMDAGFQKIQWNMAEQNGPESTRYCGGCHDPISLFSGTKNLFTDTEKLT